ncbi:transcription factor bHLH112 [Heracleum sosnowskyi]|uniref:Transcription factor bHLH112 n=1 Tax=Heracleum sosnowskyi TaxID=360622 RepID=A0AAD8MJK5_9APIA|nr:transcription factor bHLH112 [Heracleum sosnowskyi]
MADEFQAGVCAENWWMNPYQSNFGSSVCSPIINNMDIFSWPADLDLKAKGSTNDQSGSANNSEGSIVFQDTQKSLNQDSVEGNLLSVNSTLEMMDNGLSSSVTTDWNQALFHESKRNECNYQGNLQHSLNQSLDHQQAVGVDRFSQIKKDWSPENFSAIDEVTSLDAYKGPTNQGFPFNGFPSSSFVKPSPSQFLSPKFEEKLSTYPNLSVKPKNERIRDVSTVVKNNSSIEPVFKRPRIETPSPLPTFKVRKEKLGDRVTALQQLVSPFGKTDTASVLHEAIEYIKLLHDQVNVLINPYMKRGSPIQHEQTLRDIPERSDQELRSRGLCLVPVSSTFPVASETTADFWTPTFGGNFR